MPKRSPPPNRRAVEAALSDAELIALRDQAAVLGIPVDKWHLVPSFAAHWGTIATVRIADRLQAERKALSEDRALAIAAERLDLCGETVRTRLRRFFRHAYGL